MNVRKIGLIAGREFMAAVLNRGFVIGLLLMPALVALATVVGPRLARTQGPALAGQVAVVDPTGRVLPELRSTMSAEGIVGRRRDAARRALAGAPAAARSAVSEAAIDAVTGAAPDLRIVERTAGTDLEQQKSWLTERDAASRHIAVVMVHANAVVPSDGRDAYGSYDLFVPPNLDERIENVVTESLREAIISARLRTRHLDRDDIDAVMRVARPASVTVTAGEEQQTHRGFNRALPFIFAGLLVFGVLIGGQTLLTQTVEEKSSRVIEVLLSAVSPLELMAGKILGQMGVSLLVLGLYMAMGLMLLVSFAMLGLVDPWLIGYLLIFFLIAYLMFAAVFGAIGALVNEVREAQSLMTPVVLLLMLPWLLAPVISRDPNAPMSVALSLLPPVNTFAMMIRLASTTPPPAWQVWASIAIGLAAAWAAVWCAGRVFTIGVLMHGKPPNFSTLVRWIRQA